MVRRGSGYHVYRHGLFHELISMKDSQVGQILLAWMLWLSISQPHSQALLVHKLKMESVERG